MLPALIVIEAIEVNSEMSEACKSALISIGPNVIEHIGQYFGTVADVDMCLSEVLAIFPTERSAEMIMDSLEDQDYIEGRYISALEAIAHPDSVNFLIDRCDPDNPTAVEAVLTLCAIHGMDKSAIDAWLDTADEVRALRLQKRLETSKSGRRPDQIDGLQGSSGKKKTISNAERKKRGKARVMNKRKKK